MKRTHIYLVFFVSAILCSVAKAQYEPDVFTRLQKDTPGEGKIQIIQSENMRSVFMTYLESQKKMPQTNGYRICIFADTGQEARRNAENARSKFISKYENIRCYTTFKMPWYRVYVGDFRTKSEATKYLKLIERDFSGAYYVPENISTE